VAWEQAINPFPLSLNLYRAFEIDYIFFLLTLFPEKKTANSDSTREMLHAGVTIT
jgi:hypothetical protein